MAAPAVHIQPPISKEDKFELAVIFIYSLKAIQSLTSTKQLIARQVWLELVVGSNNPSLPMPRNGKKSISPHVSKDGVELMTPDWKSKINDTNKSLISIVIERIKCLPVSAFCFNSKIFSPCLQYRIL